MFQIQWKQKQNNYFEQLYVVQLKVEGVLCNCGHKGQILQHAQSSQLRSVNAMAAFVDRHIIMSLFPLCITNLFTVCCCLVYLILVRHEPCCITPSHLALL